MLNKYLQIDTFYTAYVCVCEYVWTDVIIFKVNDSYFSAVCGLTMFFLIKKFPSNLSASVFCCMIYEGIKIYRKNPVSLKCFDGASEHRSALEHLPSQAYSERRQAGMGAPWEVRAQVVSLRRLTVKQTRCRGL